MKGRLFQPRFRSGRQRAVFVLQVLRGFGASENWRHRGIPVGVTAIRCGVLRSESLAIAGKKFGNLGKNFRDLGKNFRDLGKNFRDLGKNFRDLGKNFRDLAPEQFRNFRA
jgi:hypothetical protein